MADELEERLEAARLKNLESIIAKVEGGSDLTAAELKILRDEKGKSEPERPESKTDPNPVELKGSLAQIAGEYGVSVPTLKRWKGRGAPVSRPLELLDWWRANMKNEPGKILEACERLQAAAAEVESVLEGKEPAGPVVPPPSETRQVRIGEVAVAGTEGTVAQAEEWKNAAYKELVQAGKDGKEKEILKWSRIYQDACKNALKASGDLLREKKQMGDLVDRAEVVRELSMIHAAISGGVLGALVAVCKRIDPQVSTERARVESLKIKDTLFRILNRGQFTEPVSEEEILAEAS